MYVHKYEYTYIEYSYNYTSQIYYLILNTAIKS